MLQETHWTSLKLPRGFSLKIPIMIYNIELFSFAFSSTPPETLVGTASVRGKWNYYKT